MLLERKTDGDYLLELVKEGIESPPTTEPTIEEDDTRIQLQPFEHKGHIIPVENTYYKCPWCFRIFGNRQAPVRRHLATTTGICHREKISDNLPQCFVCKSHFSSIVGLLRHTNNFRGNCTLLESVKDHDTVDVINSSKRVFVFILYTILFMFMFQLNEVRTKDTPQINRICFIASIVTGVWGIATIISEITCLLLKGNVNLILSDRLIPVRTVNSTSPPRHR